MDIYKIGVEIALSGSISSALSALSAQFMGVNREAKKLESMFGPSSAMVLGIAAAGAGMLMVSGKMLTNGAELQSQIGQMKLLLTDYASVGKDVAVATRVSVQTPGTTPAENVRMMKLMLPSVSNEAEVRKLLPLIMPDAIAAARITGTSVESIIEKGIKAEDLVGHIINPKTKEFDTERLKLGFHAQMAALIAGGGNLRPDDMLGYARQNATFARLVPDPLKMWQMAYTPMMEMGGRGAGTATAALGQQFVAGRTSKAAVQHAIALGLLDAKKTHFLGAAAASVDAGGWKGEDLLNSGNFSQWFSEVFKPAVNRHTKGPVTTADYLRELTKTVGRQNAGRLGALFTMNEAQLRRDSALVGTVAGKDFYKDIMASDMGMNIEALKTSLSSLFQILGKDMVGPAIAGIQALTAAIGQLTTLAAAHPTGAQAVGWGTLGAGVAATGWAGMKALSWLRGFGGLGGGAATETGLALGAAGTGATLGGVLKLFGGAMGMSASLATMEATDQDRKDFANLWNWMVGRKSNSGPHSQHPTRRPIGALDFNDPLGGTDSYYRNQQITNRQNRREAGGMQNITVAPQITATQSIYIDGKKIVQEILPLIIGKITATLTHPTSAPMANSSDFRPSFDGWAPAL